MQPPHSLTVMSLGDGVQFSVMALMAVEGAFDRVPDCVIFADTHWEPHSIHTHLEWLESQLRFPLQVVDNRRSLREDVEALTNHSGSRNYVDIPIYLKGRDGQGDGIGRRQCTARYASCWASGRESVSLPRPAWSCGWASPPTRPSA